MLYARIPPDRPKRGRRISAASPLTAANSSRKRAISWSASPTRPWTRSRWRSKSISNLSAELEDSLTRNPALVSQTFRYATVPREIFKRILSRKGEAGRVLRMMHRVDFLGRYIPEFGPLTCLVQHEFFHRYTADEHTLVCLEKLDALATTEEPKLRGLSRSLRETG